MRFWNRLLASLYTSFPVLADKSAGRVHAPGPVSCAWKPFAKRLKDARIALITTAGVHLKTHPPFNMTDEDGDASFRPLPSSTPPEDLFITHDYYDHTDADADINVVFPIERLIELKEIGFIGSVAEFHYGLMGHILGRNIDTLVNVTAPEIVKQLRADGVDGVVISPG